MNAPLTEAGIILSIGVMLTSYGWLSFRWGCLNPWSGLVLTAIGLVIVSLGIIVLFSWIGDRIMNDSLYTLQFTNNLLRSFEGKFGRF